MTPIRALAQAWMSTDPDVATRAQTAEMLGASDPAELRRYFARPLAFGTAGMRGPLGPGPGGMNRANVRRVTAGLAAYLVREVGSDASVVIAYDGRHGSRLFAEDAAAVLVDAGLSVWLHDEVVPTPVLAHAVCELGASGGIMVTASHNPPTDNGYKVYWGNGAQIIPPHDAGISQAIPAAGSFDAGAVSAFSAIRDRVSPVPPSCIARYRARVDALRVHRGHPLRVVYTAMHGVGWPEVSHALSRAGYSDVHAVPSQRDPDPDFPTVSFPNPEEPGALDLALALAREVQADLVVASDPDADRLAVCVPSGQGWRALTGNQVGVLLADDLLEHGQWGERPLVATTVVSTSMLRRVAKLHGAAYVETLTGFKWIANEAIAHDAQGGQFVLGFEEALGYSAGSVVRDKDGVSAALLFCDLAAWCASRGVTVLEHLEALYRRTGWYGSSMVSQTFPGLDGPERMAAIVQRFRDEPPTQIAGALVVGVRDVLLGTSTDLRSGAVAPLMLPRSNVIAFDLDDGGRLLVRPSGTEPKIKFYIEVRLDMRPGESLDQVSARGESRMKALQRAFVPLVTS